MSHNIETLSSASPVSSLPYVSDGRAADFATLGVYTVGDLISFYPRRYENRGAVCTVAESRKKITEDDTLCGNVSMILTVSSVPVIHTVRRGMVLLKVNAVDDAGAVCHLTFFNQTYLAKSLVVGRRYRFYGRVALGTGNSVSLSSPKLEALPEGDVEGSTLRSFFPVYRLAGKLTQNVVSAAIGRALGAVLREGTDFPEVLPAEFRDRYSLCTAAFAVRNIHDPEDEAALLSAQRRLMFEEIFLFACSLQLRRAGKRTVSAIPMTTPDMTPFYAVQPYQLTGAQQRAVEDFLADMTAKPYPMSRILTGDVGSGKTVCAAAALYIALKNGYQAALMAPTEILARQHYADLSAMFAKLGFSCELLVGSTKASEKERIRQGLSDGTVPLVIGTHALLEDDVCFFRCGLVITDEQHRFGVGQRAALERKSAGMNTLMMSATPIPRTMALMMYGDLDLSMLDEMPPGRKRVPTFCVDESYRERLNGFIRKQAEENHGVYIVCPSIDEQDDSDLQEDDGKQSRKAAETYAKNLREQLPGISVGILHGKMKAAEKDVVMRDFAEHRISVLVSTTVIEVGVNVPHATLMVVEDAEFFGLSQLHQLRGRVGRGSDKSWCILVSSSRSNKAHERLETLCKTNDGYKIAEADLKTRGPGDFFTGGISGDVRQSGDLHLGLASKCSDEQLMKDAFFAAAEVLGEDPNLTREEHAALRSRLYDRMKEGRTD